MYIHSDISRFSAALQDLQSHLAVVHEDALPPFQHLVQGVVDPDARDGPFRPARRVDL